MDRVILDGYRSEHFQPIGVWFEINITDRIPLSDPSVWLHEVPIDMRDSVLTFRMNMPKFCFFSCTFEDIPCSLNVFVGFFMKDTGLKHIARFNLKPLDNGVRLNIFFPGCIKHYFDLDQDFTCYFKLEDIRRVKSLRHSAGLVCAKLISDNVYQSDEVRECTGFDFSDDDYLCLTCRCLSSEVCSQN